MLNLYWQENAYVSPSLELEDLASVTDALRYLADAEGTAQGRFILRDDMQNLNVFVVDFEGDNFYVSHYPNPLPDSTV